jgi:hypothetical protein
LADNSFEIRCGLMDAVFQQSIRVVRKLHTPNDFAPRAELERGYWPSRRAISGLQGHSSGPSLAVTFTYSSPSSCHAVPPGTNPGSQIRHRNCESQYLVDARSNRARHGARVREWCDGECQPTVRQVRYSSPSSPSGSPNLAVIQFPQEVTFHEWNGAISFQTIDVGIGDWLGCSSARRRHDVSGVTTDVFGALRRSFCP